MAMDIRKFDGCNALVVGDLMIDEYLWGKVDRISPEAPVQVVSVNNENYTLGGSGNVINNLAALGATVSAVGVAGRDRHGELLLQKLNEIDVDSAGIIQEPERPTTRKTRIIAANQQVLRIDWETKDEISSATLETLAGLIEEKMPQVDVVLISDYGKGLLTDALLTRIVTAAQKHRKLTIGDPKGLDFSKYRGLSLLTPNQKEASLAAGIEIVDEATLLEAGTRILESAGIDNLLITRGRDGMTLFEQGQSPFEINAEARQVFDVSGAGDTVLAVLGLAIGAGSSLAEAAALANTAAGIVVGKVGTATVSREELSAALKPCPDELSIKRKRVAELPALVRELRQKGQRIVLTNGCFDLLHAGHIMLFSASKKLGDVLIVAMDDDESIKALKGAGRPVIKAEERVRILSALDSIDYVVEFTSRELTELIEIIQPDVLTKGSNYTSEEVFGHELVERCGGRVVLIPITEKTSSTSIINNIKKMESAP